MTIELGRVRVRCHVTFEDQTRALRIRTRLARLAAERLPAALERALGSLAADHAGGEPVRVDRLVVPLAFDPEHYDDETVAILWADRIRLALAARLAAQPSPVGPDPARRPGGITTDAPFTEAGPTTPPAVAEVLARLVRLTPQALILLARSLVAEPEGLARLRAVLGPVDRTAVLTALAAVRDPAAGTAPPEGPAPRPDVTGPRPGGRPEPGLASAGAPVEEPASSAPATWTTAWRAAAARPGATGDADRSAELVATDLRRLTERGPTTAEPQPSRVGGLVLLYPWLAEYLNDAVAARPDLAAADARRMALAMLSDPEDTGELVADPLVTCLAGAADHHRAATAPGSLSDGGESWVLGAFAGALAGFEGSTPDFIRAQFIVRPAWLVREPGGDVAVLLTRMPLDPVLTRLPYPLGLVRLPWTPAIHIRFAET
ncbi:contractile injection system tape measure protein [Streptosporangium sp. NBC_01755]|uniref:contractile injection system tape measure protein n=1 Tax=Streptosporangium sp. NBC_01755 TaxID=2975949 RepID=UPI002DD8061D|nr:contractile injection system tape measure protein [Streptosporangium sp. NBC_01755]WSD01101.1 contractile injection system tape measure protein [Streptosporangium sp. NBC_01755]